MYGHQSLDNGPLTIQAKLNEKIDILAKRTEMKHIESKSQLQLGSSSLGIGTISCNGRLITSRIHHSLYDTILHNQLIVWYAYRNNIPLDLLQNNVAWRAFKGARKKGRLGITTFMTKWVSDDTATGRVMLRRKKLYIRTAHDAMLQINVQPMCYNVNQQRHAL